MSKHKEQVPSDAREGSRQVKKNIPLGFRKGTRKVEKLGAFTVSIWRMRSVR